MDIRSSLEADGIGTYVSCRPQETVAFLAHEIDLVPVRCSQDQFHYRRWQICLRWMQIYGRIESDQGYVHITLNVSKHMA